MTRSSKRCRTINPENSSRRHKFQAIETQAQLDDRDAHRQEPRKGFALNKLHLRTLAEHRRVLHSWLVMRSLGRRGLVQQRYSDHMLEANVGNVAIVNDCSDRRRQPHDDALHLIHFERGPALTVRLDPAIVAVPLPPRART